MTVQNPSARRTGLLALLVLSALPVLLGEAQGPPTGPGYDRITIQGRDYGYVLRSGVWSFPAGADRTIFVCWENDSPQSAKESAWVQESIRNSWERHSALTFRGWGACAARNAGIRIRIADEGPHVKQLGRHLDALPDGMVLNYTFQHWSPTCQETREFCIRVIAVHEFGHALGLAHEHNRFDRPGECQRRPQGTDGTLLLTPYDPDSVMNYCNPKYINNGELSRLDIASVQQLYCPRTDANCKPRF